MAHLLAAYGLCFSIMQGKFWLSKWVHDFLLGLHPGFFQELLGCAFCLGFHCGWVIWGAEALRQGGLPEVWAVDLAIWAFSAAAFSYIAEAGVQWAESAATGG